MRAILLLLALAANAAPGPEPVFACSLGTRQVQVVQDGARLTYRFGRPGRPELVLTGDAASGTLFYHRTLYPRGEDQTLRFLSGAYAYVVYSRWLAPPTGGHIGPEHVGGGVLVLRGGRIARRLACRSGGDMHEWQIFSELPADSANLTPDDA